MQLIVDGYNISLPKGTGIATYGRNFIATARSLGHRVDLLCGDQPRDVAAGQFRQWAEVTSDFLAAPIGYYPQVVDGATLAATSLGTASVTCDAAWSRPRLFRAAKRYFRRTGRFVAVRIPGAELAHWTYPLPLYVPGARNMYTVHDLVPIKFPWMVAGGAAEYRRTCAAIARQGFDIVTVSETSRNDILSEFAISEHRVVNTYQPFDVAPRHEQKQRAANWISAHGFTRRGYFLFFGAIEPKKNIGRLLDAFEASGSDTPLVVVAAGGWGCDAERARLRALTERPKSRVRVFPYLPREELMHLIEHAKATLFPSLYEGFGLPALESMAMGTAVVAAGNASLREVVGDAGLLVDPYSVESIRDAITALDTGELLRSRLEAAGIRQAAQFSPEAYAARLRALFDRWTSP
jgi:glycosyltransferase involved in cell wall biosynthesis